MCGLIAHISNKNPEYTRETVLNQYERQHERGSRGFGLISISKPKKKEPAVCTIKRATEPVKALLDIHMSSAPIMLFHHRFPTSTDNTLEQTHPIRIAGGDLEFDWLVQHNGVIQNPEEMKKKHEALGFEYLTQVTTKYSSGGYTYSKFNDSEAFAIELVRFLEGKSEEIETRGSAAFLATKRKKKTREPISIVWGRNDGNPLKVFETHAGLSIASSLLFGEEVPENKAYELRIKDVFEIREDEELLSKAKEINLKFKKKENEWFAGRHHHHNDKRGKSKEEDATSTHFPGTITSRTHEAPLNVPARTIPIQLLGPRADGQTPLDVEDETQIIYEQGGQMDDDEEEQTPREIAFDKSFDRFHEYLGDLFYELFAEMAFGDVKDEDIGKTMKTAYDLFTESRKRANKTRHYFDIREAMEAENIKESEKSIVKAAEQQMQEELETDTANMEKKANLQP